MKKIKICHLTSVHPALDNRIFYKECVSLSNAGYNVTLIGNHSVNEVIENIRIIALEPVNSRLRRMTFLLTRLLNKALEENYEIYHLHDPELIPIGVLLKLKGKKVIYDVHEDLPNDFGLTLFTFLKNVNEL